MIDENEAHRIATSVLNRQHDDPEGPWELVEFPQGWHIKDSLQRRGSATRVVERDSGKVLRFPSALPPRAIRERFSMVVDEARVEFDPQQPTG
jgi:hypothetical protein